MMSIPFVSSLDRSPLVRHSDRNTNAMHPIRLLGLVLAPALSAAPVLHVEDDLLTPTSTIRISFDQPMVPPGAVGETVPNTLLSTEPALPGRITWVQGNVAEFAPGQAPRIGAKHTFTLRDGLTALDGSAVPAAPLGEVHAEAFHYQESYWSGQRRNPTVFIRFNDAVRPADAETSLVFRNDDRVEVPARATRATWAESGSSRILGPTWEERFTGWERPDEDTIAPTTRFANVLAVRPVRPLPVGNDWRLYIAGGLPNADGTARTIRNESRWIGTVRSFQVTNARAATIANVPRHLTIRLSKPLPDELAPAVLAENVRITPAPAGLELSVRDRGTTIVAAGDFSVRDDWKVEISSNLEAADGLGLEDRFSEEVTFRHLEPGVSLLSHEEAQLASGGRTYPIESVNMSTVRVRVKHLDGEHAVRALQGYRHYTGRGAAGQPASRTGVRCRWNSSPARSSTTRPANWRTPSIPRTASHSIGTRSSAIACTACSSSRWKAPPTPASGRRTARPRWPRPWCS